MATDPLAQATTQDPSQQTASDPGAGSPAQPGTYKAIIHVGGQGDMHVIVSLKGQVLCDEDVDSLDDAIKEISECITGEESSEQPEDEATEGTSDADDQSGAQDADGSQIPDAATMWQQEARKRQGQTQSIVAPGSQV